MSLKCKLGFHKWNKINLHVVDTVVPGEPPKCCIEYRCGCGESSWDHKKYEVTIVVPEKFSTKEQ